MYSRARSVYRQVAVVFVCNGLVVHIFVKSRLARGVFGEFYVWQRYAAEYLRIFSAFPKHDRGETVAVFREHDISFLRNRRKRGRYFGFQSEIDEPPFLSLFGYAGEGIDVAGVFDFKSRSLPYGVEREFAAVDIDISRVPYVNAGRIVCNVAYLFALLFGQSVCAAEIV